MNPSASIPAPTGTVQDLPTEAAAEPRPEPPLPSDCCGSGCQVCVHEAYERELERWTAAQRAAAGRATA